MGEAHLRTTFFFCRVNNCRQQLAGILNACLNVWMLVWMAGHSYRSHLTTTRFANPGNTLSNEVKFGYPPSGYPGDI